MRSSVKPTRGPAKGPGGRRTWGSSKRASSGKRSRGAVLLSRVTQSDSEICAVVGAERTVVTRWKLGERVPGDDYRRILNAEYGIPEDAWDQDGRTPAPALPAQPLAFGDACERMKALVHRLIERAEFYEREGDQKLASRYTRDGVAALVQLGKLTGESLEISSAKAVKIPAVRMLVERLIGALRNCPEGLKLVIAALEGKSGDDPFTH